MTDGEVVLSGAGGGFADENWAVFFAFAANDEFATVKIDGVAVKIDEFGNAETAREEELNNSAIS